MKLLARLLAFIATLALTVPAFADDAPLDQFPERAFQLASIPLTGAGKVGVGLAPIVYSTSLGAIFNPDTNILAGALGGTNGKTLTHAFAIYTTRTDNQATPLTVNYQTLFTTDPASQCESTAGTAKGLCFAFDHTIGQWNYNGTLGTVGNDIKIITPLSSFPTPTQWDFYLVSLDALGGVSVLAASAPASARG